MDRLILLTPKFQDPSFPDRDFYCWHCVLLEGLISLYPFLQTQIEVERVDWQRPRARLIELVGPENQSLPLLILSQGKVSRYSTGAWQGQSFISDKDAILKYLADEYRIPEPHP
ncbi:MAG: DUF3088 domain-containing protein [Bdellovibrionaceae bacterium]|nr:DUF3088 domain-containing protein [Pseudobdellovibrionaceae bacterium]